MERLYALILAVALTLVGLFALHPAARAPAAATARIARFTTTPPGPVPLDAALGGSVSVSGTQATALTVQATGVGTATINTVSSYILTPTLKVTLDLSNRPVPISNGSLTATNANGDELHGLFTGQGTVLDTPGFIAISGTCTFTGGSGRFIGASGTGTISGVINVLKLVFVASVKGTITAPNL